MLDKEGGWKVGASRGFFLQRAPLFSGSFWSITSPVKERNANISLL